MILQNIEPADLADLLSADYVEPVAPVDAPERVLFELEGDAALSNGAIQTRCSRTRRPGARYGA